MTIAVKFGGTSLADAAQFRKVAAIIKADANRRAVVVSAPGNPASQPFMDVANRLLEKEQIIS